MQSGNQAIRRSGDQATRRSGNQAIRHLVDEERREHALERGCHQQRAGDGELQVAQRVADEAQQR
eukprot:5196760-Prymnesium_polylepis.1